MMFRKCNPMRPVGPTSWTGRWQCAGSLQVCKEDGRGRFLQASAKVEADQLIMVVPAHAILAEGMGTATYQASHWMLGIAHRLLEEDCLENSAFAPYVRLLMEGEPHEFDAMAALPGCVGSLARERKKLRCAHVSELVRAMPGCDPERAARALHTVDTRTVYSHPARVRALVPLFDFANHSANPNARWIMGPDRALRLYATKPVDIGCEVTISYDNISNGRLLVTYGFVLEGDGPHRCVDLNVGPLPEQETPLLQTCAVQLQVLGGGCLRRRAALLPVLNMIRGHQEGEVLLAMHLLQQVQDELLEWEAAAAGPFQDGRFQVLSTMTVQVLGSFRDKLKAWLKDPEKVPLMSALGPTTEALGLHSDSDSSEVTD
ncbi:unnamed protein product [Durusdinium trenchii]|uniref:SET domain-containing protein n=1 Tax=Durusdinium trenchii TaxID=1381693 RepID=A0ABP0Q5Z5_9DINO